MLIVFCSYHLYTCNLSWDAWKKHRIAERARGYCMRTRNFIDVAGENLSDSGRIIKSPNANCQG